MLLQHRHKIYANIDNVAGLFEEDDEGHFSDELFLVIAPGREAYTPELLK